MSLYYLYNFNVDTTITRDFAYIQEDSAARKVYIKDNQFGTGETILFDFSLLVGDTLDSCYITGYFIPQVVTNIDQVTLFDGSVRKRWHFDSGFSYTESVGCSQGYFYPMETGLGFWYTTHCYSVDNVHLYGPQCFTLLNNRSLPSSTGVNIYPNPAQQQVTIDRVQEGAATFRVFNVLGQVVLTTALQQRQEQLSLRQLPAGQYYYTIDQVAVGSLLVE